MFADSIRGVEEDWTIDNHHYYYYFQARERSRFVESSAPLPLHDVPDEPGEKLASAFTEQTIRITQPLTSALTQWGGLCVFWGQSVS